jgi:hypothetical protein
MSTSRKFLAVVVLLGSALILIAVLLPHEPPRTVLNQFRAAKNIQKLITAEQKYTARHPDIGFACNIGGLHEEHSDSEDSLVDSILASGIESGYHFEIRCPQGSSQKVTTYTVTALPVVLGKTGNYAICSDQGGMIWYSENGSASDCLAMHKPMEFPTTE